MRDQRIEGGPTLGGVDARHSTCVAGVRGKAVDGLGRHGDDLARAKQLCGPREAGVVVAYDFRRLSSHRHRLYRPLDAPHVGRCTAMTSTAPVAAKRLLPG